MPQSLQKRLKRLKAFTLIEILVVVSIIGVLAGASTVSYTKSESKTRDQQRKKDLQTIQSALNLYYQQNGKYPPVSTTPATPSFYSTGGTNWIPDLSAFLNKAPQDPAQAKTPQSLLYALLDHMSQANIVYATGGGCGTSAAAQANISGGQVTSVTLICPGSGYTAAPYIIFSGGTTGTVATATTTVSGGQVTAVNITDPGSGYTSVPSTNFEPPPGGGTPPATPTPTPGGIPTPPPAAVGCADSISQDYYYCYTVNASRSRYVLWGRLENAADADIATSSTASCREAVPPSTNLNFCIESE